MILADKLISGVVHQCIEGVWTQPSLDVCQHRLSDSRFLYKLVQVNADSMVSGRGRMVQAVKPTNAITRVLECFDQGGTNGASRSCDKSEA